MNYEIVKQDNWYKELIEDLKQLEYTGVVLTKHSIGTRILEDFNKLGKPEYGSKRVANIAKDMDVSRGEVNMCIKFAQKYPTLSDGVRQLSWRKITHELLYAPREPAETPPIPEGKYTVIYADPPWEYDTDFSRKPVEGHYPTMTLEELIEFGEKVKTLAADDCVLFLWVTTAKLNWFASIIEAWGFEHKTSMVWDKVKYNMGYYCSPRHEILIIAGKGSSTPTVEDKKIIQSIDSVQSIEKTRHSEKPEEFRTIIDKLYPGAKKIELFARVKGVEGWDFWGLDLEKRKE